MPEYEFYVGVDWATAAHQVAILDAEGRRIAERSVVHSGLGLTALVDVLRGLGAAPPRVAVGIEVPRGAVVDALLAYGCHVFALNPKQLDRFRDRHTVAGAKDDRRDAFVLADALRTDGGAYRRLQPEDPRVIQLRETSRLHGELGEEFGRLTNRLREQLHRFYPQALTLCPAADEPWLWTLLEQAPMPATARRMRLSTVRALLVDYRIRRFAADALHAALQVPPLPVAPGLAEAASAHVEMLLPRIRLVYAQRRECERRLERGLAALAALTPETREHRDVTILRSLPGVGKVVAATMLAEAGHALATRDYQTLRAHAGVAPVTRQSGKTRIVGMRRSCNTRLRDAVFHWARNSIRIDLRCRAHYDRLRQRHGHARALRGVADRLLSILVAMLRGATCYDPARRRVMAA